jgi:hypothetical protein
LTEPATPVARCIRNERHQRRKYVIAKILGAVVGKKMAGRYGNGFRGAVIGAAAPMLARRAFGPLGLAVAGGYLAKKMYDKRRGTRVRY